MSAALEKARAAAELLAASREPESLQALADQFKAAYEEDPQGVFFKVRDEMRTLASDRVHFNHAAVEFAKEMTKAQQEEFIIANAVPALRAAGWPKPHTKPMADAIWGVADAKWPLQRVFDSAEWAAFDGPVLVSHPMLDSIDENVVLRQLLDDLANATAGRAAATTAFQRMAMDERIRTLVRRIDMRKSLSPVKLQNRDRSTAASIAQVKSIAANPDPDLLGYSKVATDGAPMVFSDYDEVRIPARQLGRKDRVTFAKDMSKVSVQYAVVEADDVMVSHDSNGAVVEGYDAMEAPGKLRAVAGNGRAAGIKLAYASDRAAAYRAGLIEDADLLGLNVAAIEALSQPVLVRVMLHADVTADIGDKTNTTGMAGLSATEQAKTDGDRIDFERLSFNEDGTPTIDALTRFVQAMPQAEQANLAPDGTPTTQALDRMMAATFNRAYQSDDLVKLYSQSLDPEIKNVLFGMAQAAGDMAALAGKGEFDIRAFVTDAAGMASNAKRAGLPLSRMAEQRDMTMPEESNDIAAMFARNARSPRKIADALRTLARAALAEADAPAEDMFGPVEKRTPAALVQEATKD